ncbi:MAG: hypothetical protein KAX05_00335, partial [Bacteroidales bacterium]|nr:hypothetical protein [Bacteroidales bacterium]
HRAGIIPLFQHSIIIRSHGPSHNLLMRFSLSSSLKRSIIPTFHSSILPPFHSSILAFERIFYFF